ncbi:MAG: lipase family protein [Phaeodactylibacter sp.]|nr:lipase family protein [Phaeodactylibacter sp.]
MPAPKQEAIGQSLSALKSGLPLFHRDFVNIAWDFAAQAGPADFLLQAKAFNENLANTLAVFRNRLSRAAAEDASLEQAVGHAFLHYVVNTGGQIPDTGPDAPFDAFDAAKRYAELLSVSVIRNEEDFFLEVDDKQIPFPELGSLPADSGTAPLRQVGQYINKVRYGHEGIIPSFVFDFDENASKHTLTNALAMADLSHLAYYGPAFVEKQLRQWGYDAFRWVEDDKSDTQAFVAGKGGHLAICFRGTSSGKDILVDARFLKTRAYGGRGRVHRGFDNALGRVWEKLRAAVDELGAGRKLFASGHSLGAALAQLAAHRFALDGYTVAAVYAYGSPRIGNPEFRDAYNQILEPVTFVHINNKDIVARIPPRILGFRHLGGGPLLFDEGHTLSVMPKPKSILGAEEEEMDFEELDEETQKAIMRQMQEAMASVEASARELRAVPEFPDGANSKGLFDIAPADDHSMNEYFFKFGNAVVEEEWKRIEGKGQEAG